MTESYYSEPEDDIDADDEEMQEVMRLSLASFKEQQKRVSSSSTRAASSAVAGPGPSTSAFRALSTTSDAGSVHIRIQACDRKLETIRKQIKALQREEQETIREISDLQTLQQEILDSNTIANRANSHQASNNTTITDYFASDFEWSNAMKARMNEVFGISSFRLCQEGVCNANMDGRDIVCVMPTGGGKSLTYQLPAIMSRGCTLVISPLISLMTDQILHLRGYGVLAVMLTSATSKGEAININRQLDNMARASGQSLDDIRLCYVTPEKMAKSKSFQSKMQKLVDAGKLARIVIDEAHCISEQGHDFRKDYLLLSSCKKLWPHIPILALSATCPPAVLRDVLKVLGMKPPVNGQAAPAHGTLYFTSPLYRKNLHYKILEKPSSNARLIKEISEYILKNHPQDTGIIYCFSRKDTETVAEALREESGNKIRTGVYHAEVSSTAKTSLHERWRRGDVKVVCATIAFGLGIDKSDVRFVIHYTLPKSLDGFYQESGRAGRDGKDADCVLYYRPQDGQTIFGATVVENTAKARLHNMLRFAQDLEQCRKVQFAKYFNVSAQLDTASWSTIEEDAMDPCGHCDNCTRAPETVDLRRDVTQEAWQILMVAQAVQKERGRVTLSKLAEMARGTGKAEFNTVSGGRRRKTTTSSLDRDAVLKETVKLSKEHTEWLCVQLLLDGYLTETLVATAYNVIMYLDPGYKCSRLTDRSFEDVKSKNEPRIYCSFLKKAKRASRKSATNGIPIDSEDDSDGPPAKSRPVKRKRGSEELSLSISDSGGDPAVVFPRGSKSAAGRAIQLSNSSDADSDDSDYWSHNLRGSTSRKKPKRASKGKLKAKEVIELSSD